MDVELSWQTFACTGDILCYLDYRRQLAQQRLTPGRRKNRWIPL